MIFIRPEDIGGIGAREPIKDMARVLSRYVDGIMARTFAHDTVVELAKRVPDNLYAKMEEVNKKKNLVNKMPGVKQVKKWIDQAKKLPRIVQY